MNFRDIYNPAKGVKEDITILLEKFCQNETVRFEQFVQIWKEMRFSYFSAGRKTDYECREFYEEVMAIALPFYLPPYNFQIRVGGLYTLYGLFSTQICVPKVQIRVTREAWMQIEEFQQTALRQGHYDVEYVFQKLFAQRAFLFVATVKEVYVTAKERGTASSRDVDVAMKDSLVTSYNNVFKVFTPEIVQQLEAIHTQYQHLKLAIAGPNAERLDRALDVVDDHIMQSIDERLSQYKEKAEKVVRSHKNFRNKDDRSDTEGTDAALPSEDPDYVPSKQPGQAQVKARAFSQKGKLSKSRRHRTVRTEEASSSSSPEKPQKTSRQRGKKKEAQTSDVSSQEYGKDGIPRKTPVIEDTGLGDMLSMPTLVQEEVPKTAANKQSKKPAQSPGRKGKQKSQTNKQSKSLLESTDNNRTTPPLKSPEKSTAKSKKKRRKSGAQEHSVIVTSGSESGKSKSSPEKSKSSSGESVKGKSLGQTKVKRRKSGAQEHSIIVTSGSESAVAEAAGENKGSNTQKSEKSKSSHGKSVKGKSPGLAKVKRRKSGTQEHSVGATSESKATGAENKSSEASRSALEDNPCISSVSGKSSPMKSGKSKTSTMKSGKGKDKSDAGKSVQTSATNEIKRAQSQAVPDSETQQKQGKQNGKGKRKKSLGDPNSSEPEAKTLKMEEKPSGKNPVKSPDKKHSKLSVFYKPV